MDTKRMLLFCLLPVTLGAGPCDTMTDMSQTETGDAGDECVAVCDDLLYVDAVRADNEAFDDGLYAFGGSYPGGAYVESSCFFDSQTLRMECDNAGMTAAMGREGHRLSLTFQGAPEWLTLSLSYNQVSLGEITLTPAYEDAPPADPGCRSGCRTAREIVAVDSL
jgi:hypothetical protein